MKRDIETLLKQAKAGTKTKGCPFANIKDPDLQEYVTVLEGWEYDDINKSEVCRALREEFEWDVSQKRVYDHFKAACECR